MTHTSPTHPPAAAIRGSRASAHALRCALVLSSLLALAGILVVWRWGAALELELGAGYWALLVGLALSAAAGILALTRLPARQALCLRAAFSVAVLSQLFLLVFFPNQREPYAAGCIGLAAGAFALLVLVVSRVPGPLLGVVDRLAFGTTLSLCATEVLLRLVAALFHPAILAQTSDVAEWITAHRLQPGSMRFGFPANARGFYDRDLPAERSGTLVAVIGDSFSLGTVAHSLHFTSVAEGALADEGNACELYNVGVAGADPSHYHQLLREEVLPLRPDAIVIALFIGNDLEFELPAELHPPSPLGWVGDRRQSFLARLVTRLRNIGQEHERGDEARGGASQGEDVKALVPPEQVATTFPWFADTALETATFSVEGFRKIERERALAITRASEGYACFPWLEKIQDAAHGIPLLVLLIPDEFQVEEDVWADVIAEVDEPLERFAPQGRVARFCQQHGLAVLDLLPALRAVPPMADGRRHLYALRDTHWNARGNAVAGKELAHAVRALLAR